MSTSSGRPKPCSPGSDPASGRSTGHWQIPDNRAVSRIEGPIVGVDYHQFYLYADASDAFPAYPVENHYPGRLLAPANDAHALCIETGIAMGTVVLAVDLLDRPPADIDTGRDWEVVTEVSFEATAPSGSIFYLQTYPAQVLPPFDRFALPAGAGWYRVRGHAVGRALDFDGVISANLPGHSEPREFHLLQLWPADGPRDAVRIRDDDPWAGQSTQTG